MSSIYPPYGSAPVQLCQRCGRPLPPNEVYCGNCGLVNNSPQPGNAQAQLPSATPWGNTPTPPGAGQPGGQPWKPSPAQPSPHNQFFGFPAPQQTFGSPDRYPAESNNAYGSPVQQPFYPQLPPQPQVGGFQPGNMQGFQQTGFAQSPTANGYQPPEDHKRRPKIGLIIAMVVIMLLVVGGSVGGYAYLKRHSSTTSQVTPTVAPTSVPKGQPLFSDPLMNNNAGWDLTSKPGEFSVKIANGSMILEDDNNRLFSELIPGGKNFSDFYLTTDVVLAKGTQNNGYGIYIRGASSQTFDIATYYRFEIYGDGTFAIFKGSVDGTGTSTSSLLVNYSQSSTIQKQGNVNHIAISAKGPTMTFAVNGQTLKIVTDNTYTSGLIAFFVSNLPHTTPGAQATFSNIVVYPPQP